MTIRRARKDYPEGVVAIYDNGGKTADRYTVVYSPYQDEGREIVPYVGMSARPFDPQGVCMHGEAMPYNRPTATYGGRGCGKVIAFNELPADCVKVVLRDTLGESLA